MKDDKGRKGRKKGWMVKEAKKDGEGRMKKEE